MKIIEGQKIAGFPIVTLAEANTKEKTAVFEISNNDWNRNDYIINTRGINKNDYEKNKIVLFNHIDESVIGTSMWVKFEPSHSQADRMLAKWKVIDSSGEMGDLANEVYDLVVNEVIKGASIGIMPGEIFRGNDVTSAYKEDFGEKPKKMPYAYIRSSSMVEWSVVPIPANADTLKQKMHTMSDYMKNSLANYIALDYIPLIESISTRLDAIEKNVETLGIKPAGDGDGAKPSVVQPDMVIRKVSVNVDELLRTLTKKGN
jgi:hypothetical protein